MATLYQRLPDLVEGCNDLARKTGVRRRITVCSAFWCSDGTPHFIARRVDTMPESVLR